MTTVRVPFPVKDIDQALMNETFTYDATTGWLFWKKVSRGNGSKVGSRAGCLGADKYWNVMVNGVGYGEHRVIWTMANGEIPEGKVINHKDWNRSNNKLDNLEVVWPHENVAHGTLPKPIYCHETFTVYPSIKQAAKELGVHATSICHVLNNRRKSTGGKTFSYVTTQQPPQQQIKKDNQ